jgi:hypothetical protein
MSIIFLVMKECFVEFDFKLQEYLPRNMNDGNIRKSFFFCLAFGGL